MADFGSPVAQNVNVNPTQGIQTLSDLLQLKQQAQTLETGKSLQASARAEAVTRGVAAQGQSEAANFLKNFDFAQHIGPDGTLDMDAALKNPAFQSAGPGKELIANALLGIKNNQIKNKQDMATLNNNVVAGGSKLVGALADDDDVINGTPKGLEKINAQLDVINEMFPDQGKSLTDKFRNVINSDHIKPKDRAMALRAFQLQGEDVSAQQQQQNLQSGTNAAGQIINRKPGIAATGGGAISAPGQSQPGLNPSSPTVAGATTRQTDLGNMDLARANSISGAIQPAKAAIGLTQRVDDLADQIHSGKFAKWVKDQAAALGVADPALVARQLLAKDLGQLKTAASANAASDAKMGTILSGYPEETSAAETIHGAMDYIRGSFRQQLLRGNLLNDYRQKHSDLSGFQHADDLVTGSVDPMMAEYKELKTPAERVGFYKRNFKSAADAAAFKAKVQALSHVLGQ
jgi:hypothetical protein